MPGHAFSIEVHPVLPEALARLPELAGNLWYAWHRPTRALFALLEPELWNRTRNNPRVFLKSVDQDRLESAAKDASYLQRYHAALDAFDQYIAQASRSYRGPKFSGEDLIAYFCAEYGWHESFPNYSGGLGVLAGDHSKTASDLALPFVAVGLLYRRGYFNQSIDRDGNQIAHYRDYDTGDLPVTPALDPAGREVRVSCEFPGREVQLRVWRAQVGRVPVYLLDSNVDANTPDDREITHILYGDGEELRMQQEICLGIGGVRALRALGLAPTVWHMNEGHAAFLVLERLREEADRGLPFAAALEAVAADSVFTTHTPVAAGHDTFDNALIKSYFHEFAARLGLDEKRFLAFGHVVPNAARFSMTTLALHGSRHQNGVSRIHGRVSSRICADLWPEVPPAENPVGYVTNGVHVPTYLDQEWINLFDRELGEGRLDRLAEAGTAERILSIDDGVFWRTRQTLKASTLAHLRTRLERQLRNTLLPEARIRKLLELVDPAEPDVLTIGFARRFATYKRAALLLRDPGRLRELLHQDGRPVLFIFAGKAHPADQPGQALIRHIHEVSRRPEFVGRILLAEDYDLALARPLVAGVDVWLNTPIFPLEASGTSGMKAAINGTVNLSVLDGWWAEGYDGANGWAIAPHPEQGDEERRDRDDAAALYALLEESVIPLYYTRNGDGFPPGWVQMSKRSMATTLPRFNMVRVLHDYAECIYHPAAACGRKLRGDDARGARELAAWKQRVRESWPGVVLHSSGEMPQAVLHGQSFEVRVEAELNGLEPGDVQVEVVAEPQQGAPPEERAPDSFCSYGPAPIAERLTVALMAAGAAAAPGRHAFAAQCALPWCGRSTLQARIFPRHTLLTHPHETGLMKWL
ncbi:MAG TPA: alpha-glucan family phosphorylase [Gammaproteobacteria bacterium]|nr:alpha-glucan family phosphorylase [Gammaproteobacteria bacterium]